MMLLLDQLEVSTVIPFHGECAVGKWWYYFICAIAVQTQTNLMEQNNQWNLRWWWLMLDWYLAWWPHTCLFVVHCIVKEWQSVADSILIDIKKHLQCTFALLTDQIHDNKSQTHLHASVFGCDRDCTLPLYLSMIIGSHLQLQDVMLHCHKTNHYVPVMNFVQS